MRYILLFLLFYNLYFIDAFYYLYLHKCDSKQHFTIEYLRYQYDNKHYPMFCNNQKFILQNIKYMQHNLNYDFIDCYKKNKLYWENIWNMYGSCTDLDIYNYFNKSLILFYKYNNLLNHYNCVHDKYCVLRFNDNFQIL